MRNYRNRGCRSCKIDQFDVRNDWGLLLSSRVLPLPAPKTVEDDVAGLDGTMDYTELLTGDVTFSRREIVLQLGVENRAKYEYAFENLGVLDILNGGEHTLVFEDDPDFFYRGRFQISEYECDAKIPKIKVEINAEPFKMDVVERVATAKIETENSFDPLSAEIYSNTCEEINTLEQSVDSLLRSGWRFQVRGTPGTCAKWKLPVEKNTLYSFSLSRTSVRFLGYYKLTDPSGNELGQSFSTGENSYVLLCLYPTQGATCDFWHPKLVPAAPIEIINGRQRIFPEIHTTAECSAVFGGKTYKISAGDYENYDIYLAHGKNEISFVGEQTGTVTLRYRRGFL